MDHYAVFFIVQSFMLYIVEDNSHMDLDLLFVDWFDDEFLVISK